MPPNQVVYLKAFGEMGDLMFVYAVNGFDQCVMLVKAPPPPEKFGLSSARFEMWTAFDAPEPQEQRPVLILDLFQGKDFTLGARGFGQLDRRHKIVSKVAEVLGSFEGQTERLDIDNRRPRRAVGFDPMVQKSIDHLRMLR